MVRATFCTLSMAVEQRRGRGVRSRGERGSSHRRLEKYLQGEEDEIRLYLQCLQAALLSFSIIIPIFQYLCVFFSILQRAPYMLYVLKFSQFPVFLKFYQHLWSEFSKNTDKSVYLEALYLYCFTMLVYNGK